MQVILNVKPSYQVILSDYIHKDNLYFSLDMVPITLNLHITSLAIHQSNITNLSEGRPTNI